MYKHVCVFLAVIALLKFCYYWLQNILNYEGP
jgi:hypothetical protein